MDPALCGFLRVPQASTSPSLDAEDLLSEGGHGPALGGRLNSDASDVSAGTGKGPLSCGKLRRNVGINS